MNGETPQRWLPWGQPFDVDVAREGHETTVLTVTQMDGSHSNTIRIRLNKAMFWKLLSKLLLNMQ